MPSSATHAEDRSVTAAERRRELRRPLIRRPAAYQEVEQQGALQSFTKLTGSQRHVGLVFPDSPLRQVFLGTLVLGDEARAMEYGRDPDRDVAGWVARIDDNRWRLILPYPRYESTIDVVELVPAP